MFLLCYGCFLVNFPNGVKGCACSSECFKLKSKWSYIRTVGGSKAKSLGNINFPTQYACEQNQFQNAVLHQKKHSEKDYSRYAEPERSQEPGPWVNNLGFYLCLSEAR